MPRGTVLGTKMCGRVKCQVYIYKYFFQVFSSPFFVEDVVSAELGFELDFDRGYCLGTPAAGNHSGISITI